MLAICTQWSDIISLESMGGSNAVQVGREKESDKQRNTSNARMGCGKARQRRQCVERASDGVRREKGKRKNPSHRKAETQTERLMPEAEWQIKEHVHSLH